MRWRRSTGISSGDLNTDGLLNAAYHFYGQDLFADFYDAPERVRRVLEVIADLIVDVASYVRERTGSCSIAVNRMAERVDPRLFIHANCSVQMISPASYRGLHLPVEQRMASRIQPFGIHHCGDNMHRVAAAYAEAGHRFRGRRLGLRRGRLPRRAARCVLEPAAQPDPHAAMHARRNGRGRRETAAGRGTAGSGRRLLHQHGLRHARRQPLRRVRGGGAVSTVWGVRHVGS